MQISKCFLVVCAVAYCTALFALRAADADADLKLREALQKKLNELQTQPAAPTPQLKTPTAPAAIPAPAVAAPAADSEDVAKARAALRQKMMELQAPSGGRPTPPGQWTPRVTQPPAPPVAQPVAPAPVAKPAPPTPAPAPVVQPAPKPVLIVPPPADPEAIAKAREALRQKMKELDTQAAPAPAVKPVPAVAQPAPTPPPAVQPPPVVTPPAPAIVLPPAADAESIAKAREALRQKMKELEAQAPAPIPAPAPAPAPTPAVAQPKPVAKPAEAKPQETAVKPEVKPAPAKVTKKPAKGLQPFPPIQGPPPAVSADKQQRLAELLRKYKADEITPEEYHQQRAKIVSEP